MDPNVADLLRKHAKYLELQGSRVVCSLNDHSLPATVQAIETFVKYGYACVLGRRHVRAPAVHVNLSVQWQEVRAAQEES